MADKREYRFKINAYSPVTMPMKRLAEYLLDVSVLLGEEPNVHLIGVESSSTCPVLLVDWEAEPKVIDRVQKARNGEGPEDTQRAIATINARLRKDNASADLISRNNRKSRAPAGKQPRDPRGLGARARPALWRRPVRDDRLHRRAAVPPVAAPGAPHEGLCPLRDLLYAHRRAALRGRGARSGLPPHHRQGAGHARARAERGYRVTGAEEATRITLRYGWPQENPAATRDGVRVRIGALRLAENPLLAGLKHCNRLEQVLARREWTDPGITEALMFSSWVTSSPAS